MLAKSPKSGITFPAPAPLHGARYSMSYYYNPGTSVPALAATLEVPPSRAILAAHRELVALSVIHIWGMRASEYLSASEEQLIGRDRLLIRGKKRSQNYIIVLPGIDAQFPASTRSRPGRLVSGTSYQRVFRAAVRIRYGSLQPGHVNLSRTHAGRYDLAHQVMRQDLTAVSDCLHHRSRSSAAFYTGVKGG
jgi:hypothetical protein